MMPRIMALPFATTTVGGTSRHHYCYYYYCSNSLLFHDQKQRALSLLCSSLSFSLTTTTTTKPAAAAAPPPPLPLLPRQSSRFRGIGIRREYTSSMIGIDLKHCLFPTTATMHYQQQPPPPTQFREFGSQNAISTKNAGGNNNKNKEKNEETVGHGGGGGGIKLASLLSKHLGLSRRQSERMILSERVTLFGKIISVPNFEIKYHPSNSDLNQEDDGSSKALKVDGKLILGVEATLKTMHSEQERLQQHDDDNKSSSSARIVGNANNKKDNSFPTQEGLYSNTRIWLANKLKGELITEDDPVGRPSMLQRLTRGGVGKVYKRRRGGVPTATTTVTTPVVHLKPVGRLDMMTEGLMIFTNNGKYARELELPTNQFWRTYRVRVHGRLTLGKLRAMRKGITVRVNDTDALVAGGGGGGGANHAKDARRPRGDGVVVPSPGKLMRYGGIKVSVERKNRSTTSQGSGRGAGGGRGGGGTNTWLRITCTEGKNRQLRRILGAMGLDVTRLIRISYADYDLNTIPPGMAIEVPCKRLEGMKNRGALFSSGSQKKEKVVENVDGAATVEWINYT